jgi:hypothetical protein
MATFVSTVPCADEHRPFRPWINPKEYIMKKRATSKAMPFYALQQPIMIYDMP